MHFLNHAIEFVGHNPQALLYYLQGLAYGLGARAIIGGRHAPCAVYVASSVVHVALGVLHHLSHG